MEFLIVTGMSGAGKSNAADALEDLGFYCIDNIPPLIIPYFLDLCSKGEIDIPKIAIVTDARGGELFNDINNILEKLKENQVDYRILFLDASDNELIRRYSETRRKHPLCEKENIPVSDAIKKERLLLNTIKNKANYVIDTTNITAGQLKKRLGTLFVGNGKYSLNIQVVSFGFKYGIPADADIVMDVRFLPNPYYVEGLRAKTGNDVEIQQYVMQFEETKIFLDKLEDLIKFLIPNYISEGKNQLVIAIGCTGGKHRSVTLANELYKRLDGNSEYGLKIEHRDIGKDAVRGK